MAHGSKLFWLGVVTGLLASVSPAARGEDLVLLEDDGIEPHEQRFIRGDVNLDGAVTLADVFSIFRHLHRSTPIDCLDAADVDDKGSIDNTDAIFLLSSIFARTGNGVPEPFGVPGFDPTPDLLSCDRGLPAHAALPGARALEPEEPRRCDDRFGAADLDFIESFERAILAMAGQTGIRVPLYLTTVGELEGFTVSLHAPPDKIRLRAVEFEGTVLSPYLDDAWQGTIARLRNDGFLAATFALSIDANWRTLPQMVRRPVAYLDFDVRESVEVGEVIEVLFQALPPESGRPEIRNEVVRFGGYSSRPAACGLRVKIAPPGSLFLRGDSNRDGTVSIADPITTLTSIFTAGDALPCPDAADVDDDGRIDLTDVLYTLNFLFLDGPEPLLPFPNPGVDNPGEDGLGC